MSKRSKCETIKRGCEPAPDLSSALLGLALSCEGIRATRTTIWWRNLFVIVPVKHKHSSAGGAARRLLAPLTWPTERPPPTQPTNPGGMTSRLPSPAQIGFLLSAVFDPPPPATVCSVAPSNTNSTSSAQNNSQANSFVGPAHSRRPPVAPFAWQPLPSAGEPTWLGPNLSPLSSASPVDKGVVSLSAAR